MRLDPPFKYLNYTYKAELDPEGLFRETNQICQHHTFVIKLYSMAVVSASFSYFAFCETYQLGGENGENWRGK
jgi:hypothetical protein